MDLPKLTEPSGVYDYLITLILLIALVLGLYIVAVLLDVVEPLF